MLFSKASQNVFRRAVCSGLGLMTPGPHPPCVISVFLESVRHCPGSWPLGPGHPAPPRVSGREPSLRRWLCLHPPGAQRLLLGGKKNLDWSQNPKLQRDGQLGRWAPFQPRRQALPRRARGLAGKDSWPTALWHGGMQEAKFTVHALLLT